MQRNIDAWEQSVKSPDEEAQSSATMILALQDIAEGNIDLPKKSVRKLSE